MEISIIILVGIASVVVYLLVSVWRRTSGPGGGAGSGWDGRIRRLSRRLRQDSMEEKLHKFCPIADKFSTLDEVSEAIRQAGLESSNLIIGIDFTQSNKYQGKLTFDGQSLHAISGDGQNPYQKVITVIGKTLEPFDDDDVIPAFGFGDLRTKDKSVFPLKASGEPCIGFEDVLQCYNTVANNVTLAGPTSFAPLIWKAIEIVKAEQGYHILLIVADGQVTSERPTRSAIVQASKYPLSIVMVGVGDGPWDMMREFDDSLPQRDFDNFQFVHYHKVAESAKQPDILFALHALMEIPDQFKAIRRLGLL